MTTQNETREIAEATAAILLGALAPDYMRITGRPTVKIDPNCDTAYTDGRGMIALPKGFLGHPVVDDIAVAMTAHEIGHWFQNLKVIHDWLDNCPQIARSAANLMLDIALEQRIVKTIPSLERALTNLGDIVRKHNAANPQQKPPKNSDPGLIIVDALFTGRFADFPAGPSGNSVADKLIALSLKMADLNLFDEGTIIDAFTKAAAIAPEVFGKPKSTKSDSKSDSNGKGGKGSKGNDKDSDKGEAGNQSAQDQQKDSSGNSDGDGQSSGQADGESSGTNENGDADLIKRIEQTSFSRGNLPGPQKESLQHAIDSAKVTKIDCAPDKIIGCSDHQPYPVSQRIAAMIQPQFIRPRIRADVVGPGRIDRRALARGDNFHRTTIDVKGGSSHAQDVVIVIDCSGSMSFGPSSPWLMAAQAAEAIMLAITRADEANHVSVFTFDDGLIRQQRPSSNGILHYRPNGGGTTFQWLPKIWNEFPKHTIIVVTDGCGDLPECSIKPSDKARTAVIGIYYDVSGMADVADRRKTIRNLDELPAAMSALIPRGVYA